MYYPPGLKRDNSVCTEFERFADPWSQSTGNSYLWAQLVTCTGLDSLILQAEMQKMILAVQNDINGNAGHQGTGWALYPPLILRLLQNLFSRKVTHITRLGLLHFIVMSSCSGPRNTIWFQILTFCNFFNKPIIFCSYFFLSNCQNIKSILHTHAILAQ